MFTDLLYLSLIAVGAPLLSRVVPVLRIPAIVLEIVGGIIIGPQVLDLIALDDHVVLLSNIGLAFLLFLAGLEVDIQQLRGPLTGLAVRGFLLSLALALAAGYLVKVLVVDEDPLLVAIILSATALGVVVPVLKDAGEIDSEFGQLVFIAGSIAEFGSILLMSLFFSKEGSSLESSLVLLGGFGVLIAVASLTVGRAWRTAWLGREMRRMEESSSQLRVRAAIAVMFVFVAIAHDLGFEAIVGSFVAGALVRALDRADPIASEQLRRKLDVIGFGFAVPFFFIATGIRLDVSQLFSSWTAAQEVVIFFVALMVVRGAPAVVYRARFGGRRSYVAGLMQATSLTFIVVAAHLGRELNKIDRPTEAALVMAGLLSVLVFPALAMMAFGRPAPAGVATELEMELEG